MSLDPVTLSLLLGGVGQLTTGLLGGSEGNELADEARAAALRERELELRRGRQLKGRQRAGFAAGGVLVDEGTPLDILAQTAADAETNALRAAFSFEQQAEEFESQGRSSLLEGILGAGQTLLGSGEIFDLFQGRSSSGSPIPKSGTTGGFGSEFFSSNIG